MRLFSFIDLPDVLTINEGKNLMAKIIDCSLEPRMSRRFGINHKYITKTLTSRNYRWYAIVRHSCYLYIQKENLLGDTSFYRTYGWSWKDGREWTLDYDDLQWSLNDLNELYNEVEGDYPPEYKAKWIIHPLRRELEQDDEPSAYQFFNIRRNN